MTNHNESAVLDDVEDTTSSGLSRRRFFAGAGMAAAVGAVVVACGDDDEQGGGTAAGGASSTTAGGGGGGAGELEIVQGAAGLEVLAVNTYTAALDAATAGDLGEVPPAVAEFVTTAQAQHQAVLDALNGVITGAGEAEVTEPPADLETTVNDQFAAVTDVVGAAELALMLENIAAQTYLDAQASLESPEARTLAGQAQYAGQQRGAVLNFVLGEYPVPEVFQPTDESVLGG